MWIVSHILKSINKSRLKDLSLKHFPGAQDQFDTVVIFNQAMHHNMLKEALKKGDFSEDVVILAKAAAIIQNDVFNHQCFQFSGNFRPVCQESSLPSSLKSLVSLIFNRPNLKDQDEHEFQACLTVSQFILYHIKKRPSSSAVKARRTLNRELPLPIYIGLNTHQMKQKTYPTIVPNGICVHVTGFWHLGIGLPFQYASDLKKMVLWNLLCFKKKCSLLVL